MTKKKKTTKIPRKKSAAKKRAELAHAQTRRLRLVPSTFGEATQYRAAALEAFGVLQRVAMDAPAVMTIIDKNVINAATAWYRARTHSDRPTPRAEDRLARSVEVLLKSRKQGASR